MAYGTLKRDAGIRSEATKDIKAPFVNVVKGTGLAVKTVAVGTGHMAGGAIRRDKGQFIYGLKETGKMVIVAAAGVTLVDIFVEAEAVGAETVEFRNASVGEDGIHDVSGVPYTLKTVTFDGYSIDGEFPVFSAVFEAEISEEMYYASDLTHIQAANLRLYGQLMDNPLLAGQIGLDPGQVAALEYPVAPEGYTWHHHEDPGRLQLVDQELHAQSAHIGGRVIWGGGAEYR